MNLVLGIMARIAPQMNVFFLGMPLKIIVGFIILISSCEPELPMPTITETEK